MKPRSVHSALRVFFLFDRCALFSIQHALFVHTSPELIPARSTASCGVLLA